MFIYQQQPRVLHHETGELPVFPSLVRYEFNLHPEYVLGGTSGDLPVVIPDHSLSVEWNGPTGRASIRQDPPLASISLEAEIMDGKCTVTGAVVLLERKCASLAEAADTLDALRLLLPSVLAVFLPRPVTVTYARIVAGSAILRSELRRAAYAIEVVTEEDYLDRVRYAMSAADVILNGNHSALLAAAAYMHAAERLASIGNSPVEFAPEILLNLTKVLEVLFGNTRDRIRAGLTSLGYGEAEREGIFIPLVIMRNEIDVGHAKLTSLSPDVLDQLYSFLIDVPFSMKELIVRAVNATSLGTWQPPTPDPPGAPGDFGRLLASIEAGDRARTERVGKRLYLHFKRGISESADGGGSAVAVEPSR